MDIIDHCDMCDVFDTVSTISLNDYVIEEGNKGIIFYVCRRCKKDYEANEQSEVFYDDFSDWSDLCL
jgi:hypothetical protein